MTALLGGRARPAAKRINPVNRKRRKRLWERNYGEKAEWIRQLNCEVTGRVAEDGWKIDAAHTKARGMGGCGGDKTHLVPLERTVHLDFDELPEARFAEKYGRTKQSVREAAARYESRWQGVQLDKADLAF